MRDRVPGSYAARLGCCAILLALLWSPQAVRAAHPLITEDAATQGRGRFELEIGNAWTRDGSDRSFEFGPQLSYGALPQLDLILRPTWLDQRMAQDTGTVHASGLGDTAADLKWQFLKRDPLSLAVRAGISAPTGDADRGLGLGKASFHGLLVSSVDLAPFAVHSNIGYTQNRGEATERRDLYHLSTAVLWTVNDAWRVLLVELAADTQVDNTRATPPAVARFAVIHTVKKNLDVDLGYQLRVNRAAPRQVVLFGITARWGP